MADDFLKYLQIDVELGASGALSSAFKFANFRRLCAEIGIHIAAEAEA
jgi:hypothetical protein